MLTTDRKLREIWYSHVISFDDNSLTEVAVNFEVDGGNFQRPIDDGLIQMSIWQRINCNGIKRLIEKNGKPNLGEPDLLPSETKSPHIQKGSLYFLPNIVMWSQMKGLD